MGSVFNLLRKQPGLRSSEATPSNVPTSNRDEGSNFSASSPTPGCYVSAVIQTIDDLWSSYQGLLVHSQQAGAWRTQGKPEARAAAGRASSPTAWVCGVRACQAPSWAPPVMPLLTSTASRATGSGTTVPGPWLRPWPPTGPSPCCSEWACWLAENSFLSSLLLPPRASLFPAQRGGWDKARRLSEPSAWPLENLTSTAFLENGCWGNNYKQSLPPRWAILSTNAEKYETA